MEAPNDAEKIGQAAREFVSLAINKLNNEKGVHAETAIAAVARMAGTFLFRSFGFQLPDAKPGQPVFSEQANEQGPRLVDLAATVLQDSGISVDIDKVADGPESGHEPLLGFLETQKLLEPDFNAVRERLGLSLQQAADAGTLAAAMLIGQTRQVLDSNIAFGVAVFSFVEGTKTLPADL